MKNLMQYVVVVGLCMAWSASMGATHFVCPDGSGDFKSIQTAIATANDGDIVELCDTTFTEQSPGGEGFVGTKRVTVRSRSGDPLRCVIDLQYSGRGFYYHGSQGPETELEGIAVIHGYSDTGPAIYLYNYSAPTIRNCIFAGNVVVDNEPHHGGAVTVQNSSSPMIDRCTFVDNAATGDRGFGGALYCWEDSNPHVRSCTFTANTANEGGAIWCGTRAAPVFERCVLWDDAAGRWSEVFVDGSSQVTFSCSLVDFSEVGGDGAVSYQDCLDRDPLLCDTNNLYFNPDGRPYKLYSDSPCFVENRDVYPACGLIGAWADSCLGLSTGVGDDLPSRRPEAMILASPNPCRDGTKITYSRLGAGAPGTAALTIHDAVGRVSRVLRRASGETGPCSTWWDGRDNAGRLVPSGIYVVRADDAGTIKPTKVLLLR